MSSEPKTVPVVPYKRSPPSPVPPNGREYPKPGPKPVPVHGYKRSPPSPSSPKKR